MMGPYTSSWDVCIGSSSSYDTAYAIQPSQMYYINNFGLYGTIGGAVAGGLGQVNGIVPPTKNPRDKLRSEIESWCGNVLEVA